MEIKNVKEKEISQIKNELALLEKTAKTADKISEEIEIKLDDVLKKDVKEVEKKNKDNRMLVTLAIRIKNQRELLEKVNIRMRSILERCEL